MQLASNYRCYRYKIEWNTGQGAAAAAAATRSSQFLRNSYSPSSRSRRLQRHSQQQPSLSHVILAVERAACLTLHDPVGRAVVDWPRCVLSSLSRLPSQSLTNLFVYLYAFGWMAVWVSDRSVFLVLLTGPLSGSSISLCCPVPLCVRVLMCISLDFVELPTSRISTSTAAAATTITIADP